MHLGYSFLLCRVKGHPGSAAQVAASSFSKRVLFATTVYSNFIPHFDRVVTLPCYHNTDQHEQRATRNGIPIVYYCSLSAATHQCLPFYQKHCILLQ